MDHDDLIEVFAEARQRLPDLTRGSSPLGVGSNGLVIDHHDGSVSKLYFNLDDLNLDDDPAKDFATELHCLSQLARYPIKEMPYLIQEPIYVEDEEFFGVFRMTKLSGRTAEAVTCGRNAITGDKLAGHHRSIGRLLARFHAVAIEAELAPMPAVMPPGVVAPIAGVDDAVNRALERALIFRQAHCRRGIAHRDLRDANILVDRKASATGVLDFHSVGAVENVYSDLPSVFNRPAEARDVVAGYSEESGIKLEPVMLAVESIAQQAAFVGTTPQTSKYWAGRVGRLRKYLVEAHTVTGYQPSPQT